LAGQPGSYIANQLRAWQNDQRDPGPQGLMGGIANKLTAADVAAVAAYFGGAEAPGAATVEPAGAAAAGPDPGVPSTRRGSFVPPDEVTIPENAFGNMLRLGERIFEDPRRYAAAYVGNELHCSNCHLDAGRKADSAPLWAAYVSYPAYREKNHRVITFDERMQDCFRFSMNGRAPPLGSPTLVALDAYAYWLASGAVVSPKLPGRGYPKVPVPVGMDPDHGRQIYAQRCALCHGDDGAGQNAADGQAAFPAVWGPNSFNWGAGMANISKAAGFVRANMPLSQPNTLSDRDAYDVAAYIDGHERPQDPRYGVSVAQTRARYHDSADSLYGRRVGGHLLGSARAGGSQ
jgi:thiosulfate dehydrogenase